MSRWALRLVIVGWGGWLAAAAGCSNATKGVDLAAVTAESEVAEKESAAEEKPGAPFRLPEDAGGKMLGKVLPPDTLPAVLRRAAPPRPAGAGKLPRLPEPPPSETAAAPVLLPAPPSKRVVRPEFVLGEGLEESFDRPGTPRAPLAAGKLLKEKAADVSLAPPLPVTATSLPDRVPLDDATSGASTAAVLAAPLPSRSQALPFTRLSRPEPYENRVPLTLPVREEAAPHGPTPAVPR